MKQNAVLAGVGITKFGRHTDRNLSDLAREAIEQALDDAGVDKSEIEAVWAGNAAAPITTGQVCIAGQAILRGMGIGQIPVINVENACATSATAFQQAASMVTLGAYDVVLAFGCEKMYGADKTRVFSVFDGCADIENPDYLQQFILGDGCSGVANERQRSVFMDIYARKAREYMDLSGATQEDFARLVEKNAFHSSLNPNAQFCTPNTAEQVISSEGIVYPLTIMMCSPIADGAAAAVIMSPKAARRLGVSQPISVLSSALASGYDQTGDTPELMAWLGQQVYNEAGIGPSDLSCLEVHDASAPAELIYCEELGLCESGGAVRMLHDGDTRLGGRVPINTSGGLVRKGHPIGATGIGQIHELAQQLRGRAGERQVENARFALAENGGGFLGTDSAALAMTVLGMMD